MCAGWRRARLASAVAATLSLSAPAKAEYVDLELLLAVDASVSVDKDEYALQMKGIANAFRHPDVIGAIRSSAPNGISVALMQWAGPSEQMFAVPWSTVRDRSGAYAFAEDVDRVPRPRTGGGTAIGDALIVGLSLLSENGIDGIRQVIDVSGDGRTNQGTSPAPVRTHAASLGTTINGLAILSDEPQLMFYYRDRVIGGPGAFVLEATDFQDFQRAIRLKLIREIEGSVTAFLLR